MQDIFTRLGGTQRRLRPTSITWDDTAWPGRGSHVQFGLTDRREMPVLIELNKRQARALAIHLLREAEGR